MNWKPYAASLAADVTHPGSDWWEPVRETPRHVLVERWFAPGGGGWQAVDGPADEEGWAGAAYANRTLVTKVGPRTRTRLPRSGS